MRFREDTPALQELARATVATWRREHPAAGALEMIEALGGQFHRDYGPVLRALLFAADRHAAREITGDGR